MNGEDQQTADRVAKTDDVIRTGQQLIDSLLHNASKLNAWIEQLRDETEKLKRMTGEKPSD